MATRQAGECQLLLAGSKRGRAETKRGAAELRRGQRVSTPRAAEAELSSARCGPSAAELRGLPAPVSLSLSSLLNSFPSPSSAALDSRSIHKRLQSGEKRASSHSHPPVDVGRVVHSTSSPSHVASVAFTDRVHCSSSPTVAASFAAPPPTLCAFQVSRTPPPAQHATAAHRSVHPHRRCCCRSLCSLRPSSAHSPPSLTGRPPPAPPSHRSPPQPPSTSPYSLLPHPPILSPSPLLKMGSEAGGGSSPPLSYSSAPFLFSPSSRQHRPPPPHPPHPYQEQSHSQQQPPPSSSSSSPSSSMLPPPAYHARLPHPHLFHSPSHSAAHAPPPYASRSVSHPTTSFSSHPPPDQQHAFSPPLHPYMPSPSLSPAMVSSSSSSASSSPSFSSSPPVSSHQASLYKTELCKSWQSSGCCRYSSKCKFAHGSAELVAVQRHRKYKTEPCRNFTQDGYCRYADRCKFIHDGDENTQAAIGVNGRAGQPQPQPQPQQLHSPHPASPYRQQQQQQQQHQAQHLYLSPSLTPATPTFYPPPSPRHPAQSSIRDATHASTPFPPSLRSPVTLIAATSTPVMHTCGVGEQQQQRHGVSPMLLSSHPHSRSSSASSSLVEHDGGGAAQWLSEQEEKRGEGEAYAPTVASSSRVSPRLPSALHHAPQQSLPYPSSLSASSSPYPYISPPLAAARAVGAAALAPSPQSTHHWLPSSASDYTRSLAALSLASSSPDAQQTQQPHFHQSQQQRRPLQQQAASTAALWQGAAAEELAAAGGYPSPSPEAARLSSDEEGEAAGSGQSIYHLQRSLLQSEHEHTREEAPTASSWASPSVHSGSSPSSSLSSSSSSSSLSSMLLNAVSSSFSPRPVRPPVLVDVTEGNRAPQVTALQTLKSPAFNPAGEAERAEDSAGRGYTFPAHADTETPSSSARFRSQSVDQRRPSSASSSASSNFSLGAAHHGSSSRSPHPPSVDEPAEQPGAVEPGTESRRGGAAAAAWHGHQPRSTILPRARQEGLIGGAGGASAGLHSSARHGILPVDTSSSASARAPHAGHAVSPGTGSSSSSLSPRISSGSPSFPPLVASGFLPAVSVWSDRSSSFSSSLSCGGVDSTSSTRTSSYVHSPLVFPQSPFTSSPGSTSAFMASPPPQLQLPRAAQHSPAPSAASSACSSPHHQHYTAVRRPHRYSADLSCDDAVAEDSPLLDDAASGAGWSTQPRANRPPVMRPLTSTSSSSAASSAASSKSSSPTGSPFVGASSPSAPSSPWQSALRPSVHLLDEQQQQQQQPRVSAPSTPSSLTARSGPMAIPPLMSPSSRRPAPVHVQAPSNASSSSSPSSAASISSQVKRPLDCNWRARPGADTR